MQCQKQMVSNNLKFSSPHTLAEILTFMFTFKPRKQKN